MARGAISKFCLQHF